MMAGKTAKRPKPATREGFGVLNPYGDMWTTEIFDTEEDAREHVRRFWRNIKSDTDLTKFKVVPAVQRTSFREALSKAKEGKE